MDENDVQPNEDGTFELPTTITVLVSVAQAQDLANYEEIATMHVALVYRGDEETAQQFLMQQEEILNKHQTTQSNGNGGEANG